MRENSRVLGEGQRYRLSHDRPPQLLRAHIKPCAEFPYAESCHPRELVTSDEQARRESRDSGRHSGFD